MSSRSISGIFLVIIAILNLSIVMMHFIELRSFDNYIIANIVLGMLKDAGINCHLKDEHIITIDPLLSPAIGGMKLMVYDKQVTEAWSLIEEAERQYIETIPCSICKQHSLSAVTITKNYKTLLGALGSMFLNGQPVRITKKYKCGYCGYDFKELPKRR